MLVSTHYMDEAERCHEIAYIVYGRLIARGTADEVIAESGLVTFRGEGPGADRLAHELDGKPGVRHGRAVRPGRCTSAAPTARRWRPPSRPTASAPFVWAEVEPTLEDVFIHLMGASAGQLRMSGFSFTRVLAVLAKEFIQLARDRLTYAMILVMPVMQLLLFGYAINTDPKHLPTGVLVQDQRRLARSTLRR